MLNANAPHLTLTHEGISNDFGRQALAPPFCLGIERASPHSALNEDESSRKK